jgi:hypothetical protein
VGRLQDGGSAVVFHLCFPTGRSMGQDAVTATVEIDAAGAQFFWVCVHAQTALGQVQS